ncbi:MAG: YfiM family protein, partial [Cytophagales bacterium]|nr:YfiM family protein [Cytophagales bacterium]
MNRKIILFFGIYILWLVIVSVFWYSNFIGFHWFNDVQEWAYMDKLGHFFTSFYMGCFYVELVGNGDSTKLHPSKPYMGLIGFFLLLPVEILDGLSPNYGASFADLIFNALGSMYCYAYLTHSKAHAFLPKFSFHYTPYALIRPDLLGNG